MRHSQYTLLPVQDQVIQVTVLQMGGLEVLYFEITLLPWDLNRCPLGHEPKTPPKTTSAPICKCVYHTHTHTHTPADIIGKVNK